MVQGQNSSGTLALTPAWFLEVKHNHLTPSPARLIYCSQWTRRPLKRCKFAVWRRTTHPSLPPTTLSTPVAHKSVEGGGGGVGVGSFGEGRRPFYHLLKTAIGAKSLTRHDWMLRILPGVRLSDGVRRPEATRRRSVFEIRSKSLKTASPKRSRSSFTPLN